MTNLRSFFVMITVAVGIVILGAAAFVFTASYNVAATDPHSRLMQWMLHTTMHRSVTARANSIHPPAQFTQEQVREGALEFGEMCAPCHGAPGKERGEMGKGLNPSPPDLAEVGSEWSSAEIFWIVKNGIKMTGMPAFGPTHPDDLLWSIVAFVRQLPQVTPEDYKKIENTLSQKHPTNEHEHTHEHDHQH